MTTEEQQSIQFFKIKLMEKDRQIADFQTKMKKLQFKHNRELKELKINQERLQRNVKDQKTKNQKSAVQVKQLKDQNTQIRLKFTQFKQEKDKQIIQIYNKYNVLKEQVRSYQRILPTFTFLLQIDKSMSEIPVYQDLYINLNQKTIQLTDLSSKFEQSKVQWEQIIKNMKLNEQLLKNKKLQAEKISKQMLAKVYEYQQNIYQVKNQNSNLNNVINELQEELELGRERGQSLEQSIREYESKIQRLGQEFEVLLRNKEEQVNYMNQQERLELQQKVQSTIEQSEKKQMLYLQQIHSFEEQLEYQSSKYKQELSNFQQHFMTLKEQTQSMKDQINNEKKRYDSLNERYNENVNNLSRLSIINDKNEQKIAMLQGVISNYKNQIKEKLNQKQNESNEKLKKKQQEFQQIESRYLKLNQSLSSILEQKDNLQHQNTILRQEINHKQKQLQDINSNLLQIPHRISQSEFNQFIRRRSLSISEKKQDQELDRIIVLQPNQVSEDKIFTHFRRSIQEKKQESQIDAIASQQSRASFAKIKELQSQIFTQKQTINNLSETNNHLQSQLTTTKQKYLSLSKQFNQLQASSSKNIVSIYKLKLKTMQEQLKIAKDQGSKLKEEGHKLKAKNKEQIETLKNQINNYKKEIKDINKDIQAKQKQYKKIKNQDKIKIQALQSSIIGLRGTKQGQNIRKRQIQRYKQEMLVLENKLMESQQQNQQKKLQNYNQKQLISKMQQEVRQKTRQIQRISQSLLRQRKERSMLTAPSLPSLQFINDEANQQLTVTNPLFEKLSEKQEIISDLQRQLSDLKEEKSLQIQTNKGCIEELEKENKYYVQTIIEMKMRCAQSEMRANEKEYLYVQLKKKMKM